MTFVDLAVFASIAAGVVCWALGEALRSRIFWTAGAILTLIHSIAAFGVFYGWSHETARRLTTQQTAALTGVEFGGGIYVNYLFLVVWLADSTWWWMSPRSYERRPRALSWLIRGFIFFIIVNGAVIFADGWARIVGLASTSLVLASWFLKRWSRRGASTTAGLF
jgi:hypothetical protein